LFLWLYFLRERTGGGIRGVVFVVVFAVAFALLQFGR
jgi:hypothetical protein